MIFLFANDIVLLDELHNAMHEMLKVCRRTMKAKGFRLSRTKIKYFECKFNEGFYEKDVDMGLGT